ncbi:flagellar brake protein [Metabacillus herbersteinensis]|uniref:Flagellar brake protein n=1 Tax=Metabacillus herbersteinensis TaxID=283816 RepID=A0ABV6GD16_9BACI
MLNIGDVLLLETKDLTNEKLKCKLVERKGNQLYIDYPINEKTGRTAYLMMGTELYVSFVRKDQNAFKFQSEVTGRLKENIPMISLTFPGDDQVIRIQRREYVRVDTNIDIAIHSLNDEFQPFTAVTSDLSAGGTAIIIPRESPLNNGQEVNVWFSLPFQNGNIEHLNVKSKVIRILPGEHPGYNKLPLQFLNIEEKAQQTVIRFCFDQQILMKRRGVIFE